MRPVSNTLLITKRSYEYLLKYGNLEYRKKSFDFPPHDFPGAFTLIIIGYIRYY